MLFTTILATAALALGVPAEPQNDELPFNVIGSRIWSSPDCGGNNTMGNIGQLTTHRDRLGECFKFSNKVKSVSQTEHAKGCKLYQDANCRRGVKSPKHSQCLKAPTHFNSYKTVCSQVA
ncbi:hypothetical protein FLAG1_11512 [Fusarium langsethiae]|uniref:Uncharacterized protein n=1 Tax=Fusarium langsethiae TaxID=179993 RepID=A0A0M9EMI4_FUSLA|nr:hypothetical protein FLAG1_11512 [Fusarium langsethiae]GKU09747.1 unnamed protein product [Fusarium langsethiae]GKU13726.1 unnamed protein product [Fusarium langsethiae]